MVFLAGTMLKAMSDALCVGFAEDRQRMETEANDIDFWAVHDFT
jgi:hypothetical protein